jgi:putative addiction module antidote
MLKGLLFATQAVDTFRYTESGAMIETKIRKVGNSAVMTMTTEMLTILDAKEGDTLFVVRGDDGSLKITPHDPAVADALAAAEIVMDENRDLLQALA